MIVSGRCLYVYREYIQQKMKIKLNSCSEGKIISNYKPITSGAM